MIKVEGGTWSCWLINIRHPFSPQSFFSFCSLLMCAGIDSSWPNDTREEKKKRWMDVELSSHLMFLIQEMCCKVYLVFCLLSHTAHAANTNMAVLQEDAKSIKSWEFQCALYTPIMPPRAWLWLHEICHRRVRLERSFSCDRREAASMWGGFKNIRSTSHVCFLSFLTCWVITGPCESLCDHVSCGHTVSLSPAISPVRLIVLWAQPSR